MQTVDLTHQIASNMPVFPGDPAPASAPFAIYEQDHYRASALSLPSHCGTHIDAPAHVLENGAFLGQFPISHFCGKARVLDCSAFDGSVTLAQLEPVLSHAAGMDYLLFYTGGEHRWLCGDYAAHIPIFEPALANCLSKIGLKGIGVDALSIDPVQGPLTCHKLLLQKNILLVENLANLSKLPPNRPFYFCALPLSYAGADGAPVRAVAFIDE